MLDGAHSARKHSAANVVLKFNDTIYPAKGHAYLPIRQALLGNLQHRQTIYIIHVESLDYAKQQE